MVWEGFSVGYLHSDVIYGANLNMNQITCFKECFEPNSYINRVCSLAFKKYQYQKQVNFKKCIESYKNNVFEVKVQDESILMSQYC